MELIKTILPCLPIKARKGSIRLPIQVAKYHQISEKAPVQPFAQGNNKSNFLPTQTAKHQPISEKAPSMGFDDKPKLSTTEAANSIVSAITNAEKPGPSLVATIQSLVHQAGGWSEYLAKKILVGLQAVLRSGNGMNAAMQTAYVKACEAAKVVGGFPADHPVFCTVIALGILVVLAPYALEWLGFAELGPVEGSWAALWQSRYAGFVPKGSLFSYFQRLGMTWK